MQFLALNVFSDFFAWVSHVYHSIDIFTFVEKWMGTDWGYGVLTGLLLACGMGLPLPEDIPLFFAGYFVADGKMNLALASICAWSGIIGGDCILYYLGFKLGPRITRVPILGSHIDESRLKWAHERFEEYGIWVVAVGRLFAGIRGVMVVTAGTIRFNLAKFLIADGLAAVVSGGLFIALGYWARLKMGNPQQMELKIEHYKKLVTTGVIVVVVIWLLWQWWKNQQKQKRKAALIKNAAHREAASGQGL